MRVLVACEFSGVVRDAFIARGHDAISCDLLPTEKAGPHHQGDIMHYLTKTMYQWDLMIAHPPCTFLTNSGVWLLTSEKVPKEQRDERFVNMRKGALFFKALLNADIPRIAIENPVMHGFATEIIGRKQDQCVQPYHFGHEDSKNTCLWLKGLPRLRSTQVRKRKFAKYDNQTKSGQNKLGPSAERGKLRSITYRGMAKAMADQWGILVNLEELLNEN